MPLWTDTFNEASHRIFAARIVTCEPDLHVSEENRVARSERRRAATVRRSDALFADFRRWCVHHGSEA